MNSERHKAMENMTLEALQKIALCGKSDAALAVDEIKARVAKGKKVSKKLRKMGFTYDADTLDGTIRTQENFLKFVEK